MNKPSKLVLALCCLLPVVHITAYAEQMSSVPTSAVVAPVEQKLLHEVKLAPTPEVANTGKEWVPISNHVGWCIIAGLIYAYLLPDDVGNITNIAALKGQRMNAIKQQVLESILRSWAPGADRFWYAPLCAVIACTGFFIVTKMVAVAFNGIEETMKALGVFNPKLKEYLEKAGTRSALVSIALSLWAGIMTPCCIYWLAVSGDGENKLITKAIFNSKILSLAVLFLGFFCGCAIGYTFIYPLLRIIVYTPLQLPYVLQLCVKRAFFGAQYAFYKSKYLFYKSKEGLKWLLNKGDEWTQKDVKVRKVKAA